MNDNLKTIPYFRSQFYNEYPSTFVGTGNGTVYSAEELKDFKPKGGGGSAPTTDTYTKSEIDAKLNAINKVVAQNTKDIKENVIEINTITDADVDEWIKKFDDDQPKVE